MPLLRLQPHLFSSLPAHSSLSNDATRPELQSYTRTALQEALELLHSVPSSFTADPKLRSSSPSAAQVKLLRHWRKLPEDLSQKNNKPEFWVCRQSEHVDAEAKGTASWSEFETGLRSNHAEHEMDYTPSITGVERLLDWSRSETGEIEVNGLVFKDVDIESMHPELAFRPPFRMLTDISSKPDNSHFPSGCAYCSPHLYLFDHLCCIR
jgi:hypothetical protein